MSFRSPRQRAEVRAILQVTLSRAQQGPPPASALAAIERLLEALDAAEGPPERPDAGLVGLHSLPGETRGAALALALMGAPDGIDCWLELFRASPPGAPVSLTLRRRRERAVELALYIDALSPEARRSAALWIRVLRAGRVPLLRRSRIHPPAGRVVEFPSAMPQRGDARPLDEPRREGPDVDPGQAIEVVRR